MGPLTDMNELKGLVGVSLLIFGLNAVLAQSQRSDSLVLKDRELPVVGTTTIRSSTGVTEMTSKGLRASRLISAEVYNSEGEIIGKIDDLIVDSGAVINVAILSVGGFLGIGKRLIAIPTLAMHVDNQSRVILPQGTKEKLMSMSEFRYSK